MEQRAHRAGLRRARTAPRSAPSATARIISAGYDGSYGQKIVVQHADGTETWYAHLSSFVRTGGTVKAGDVIGRVGSTGNSTGDHLHLEVRPGGGDPVPPLSWLREHGVSDLGTSRGPRGIAEPTNDLVGN